jgi:peptidoglycan/LPS O-acetylase OafA/YrhL
MKHERANNFDLLRLGAALQVAIYHGIDHFHLGENSQGWRAIQRMASIFPGVPIFFCISGFLIARSVERNLDNLSGYFRSRALRIYPALWVCVALGGATLWWFGFFNGVAKWKVAIWWLLNLGAGGATVNPDYLRHFGTGVWNGSLWTIFVELSFYVFLPLVYLVCRRINVPVERWLAVLLGVSFATFVGFHGLQYGDTKAFGFATKAVWYSLAGNLWMFLFGTLAHRYWPRIAGFFTGKMIWWTLACILLTEFMNPIELAGAGGAAFAAFRLFTLRFLVAGFTLSAAHSFRSASDRLLKGQDISYGVYVYHMLVFNVLLHLGLSATGWYFAGLAITASLAAMSWFLLERRALAWKTVTIRQAAPTA